MPHSLPNSSGSHSPTSSTSSPQASYSDTTPSPSGGNKSPSFDPHDLMSKLAFLEASESLAQAAETLSLAAKAMSKAAASLAVASGYKDHKYNKPSHGYDERSSNTQAFIEGIESPEWQENSYALPSLMPTSENESFGEAHTQHNTIHEHTTADFLDSLESTTNTTAPSEIPLFADHYDLQPAECSTPTNDSRYQPIEGSIPGNSSDMSGTTTAILPNNDASENPLGEQQAHEHPAGHFGGSDMATTNLSGIPLQPGDEVVAPVTISEAQSSTDAPQRLSQRIVLDSGFDQLPLICVLARQNPKMICLFKYWGGAPPVIGAILKKDVSQAVIFPTATKLAVLRKSAQEFASLDTGILLWPASKALPDCLGTTILREVHVLHLGEPAKETSECGGSNVTVVIAQKDLSEMTASACDKLIEEYPLDNDNEAYNQQGPGSLLHLARTHARARLGKNPSARGLYVAWLGFQRRDHPDWTAEELARRANDYAEEFLLRGEPKTDRLIGGRIPLAPAEIKSMGLRPAVDAGILTVA